ncbi:MAG: hypothetical protein RLZZ385_1645 [Pseudomonadota bacterium]
MKIIRKTLRELAVTYCQYIVLRMKFRAVMLAQSVDTPKALPCSDAAKVGCC